MKRMALLAVALLVSLPSCKKDRTDDSNRQQQVEQRANVYGSDFSSDSEYLDDEDDLATLIDVYNEDEEEFIPAGDDEDEFLPVQDDEEEYSMEENDTEEMAWIDTQIEDELKPLYFEFNKYQLNAAQKQVLNHDIEQVKQLVAEAGQSKAIVVAEGHTCQEGTPEYNIGLSENRAKSVADLLVDAGIDREIIKVVGRGQENPVVEGKTRVERAPNRRVELRVIYT